MDSINTIIRRFFPNKKGVKIQRISGGHINSTFKISFESGEDYILQALNTKVFENPYAVMNNIQNIAMHLKKSKYPLKILEPILSVNGLIEKDDSMHLWRAFPFIADTSVFENVSEPKQAYEAARAFGLFIKYLQGMDLGKIVETIPHFHDLDYRLEHFEKALSECVLDRKENAKTEINLIKKWRVIFSFDFEGMPLRIVHNDTKINNVLLDKKGEKGVCVIDLDTVMLGYVVFDFGDMIRTMCCTFSEEEKDIKKVKIDIEIFKNVAEGFLEPLKFLLTKEEKANLINGGLYIIYEQAIRFLTDYLQGDIYYPVKYENQNQIRTKNQLALLHSLQDKKSTLELIINELC